MESSTTSIPTERRCFDHERLRHGDEYVEIDDAQGLVLSFALQELRDLTESFVGAVELQYVRYMIGHRSSPFLSLIRLHFLAELLLTVDEIVVVVLPDKKGMVVDLIALLGSRRKALFEHGGDVLGRRSALCVVIECEVDVDHVGMCIEEPHQRIRAQAPKGETVRGVMTLSIIGKRCMGECVDSALEYPHSLDLFVFLLVNWFLR